MLSLFIGLWLFGSSSLPTHSEMSPHAAFVEVAGIRLQYLDWGGSGEPVILVPGGCETPYVFGDLAPLLIGRARVLGLTPRGCGASGVAMDEYGIDLQIRELIGFLDALGIERATFAGHSTGGGKVVRLARLFPSRVSRLVTFDIVYTGVPDGFERKMDAAITGKLYPQGQLSLEKHRLLFEAWELGTWSPALEREFREQIEVEMDGSIRYRRRPAGWQTAFLEDMKGGRYFEIAIAHPALMFFAQDLDLERIRQFSEDQERELRPMAEAVVKARRNQIESYARNGSHVRVVLMRKASHYLFIDRSREVAARMLEFVQRPGR